MSSAEKKVLCKIKLDESSEEGVRTYKRRRITKDEIDFGEFSTDNSSSSKLDNDKEPNCLVGKHWQSWRKILQNQLFSLREGGGIETCITAALGTGPFTLIGEPLESESINSVKETKFVLNKRIKSCPGDNTTKCQNSLLDVLVSEKFAFLCDLLVKHFEEKDFMRFINLNLIHIRMKNGQYERSPELFIQDIQHIWEKFQKIGEEIIRLTNNLANFAKTSFKKQVGGEVDCGFDDEKQEETCVLNTETCICLLDSTTKNENNIFVNNTTNNNNYNSEDSTTVQQITQSDHSSNPNPNPNFPPQTLIYRFDQNCPICKNCGLHVTNSCGLICGGCKSTYHFSCIKPPIKEFPTRSWFCNSCQITKIPLEQKSKKKQKPKKPKSLHEDCAVCKRLENTKITEISLEKEEIKIKEAIDDLAPQLCKICKCEEEEDKKFIICGHNYCPYKYYHIKCLNENQIASKEQTNRPCWYCPSCLCRGCYFDKDDENIVLCDSCDEAYHLYCMDPVREKVPSGNWYCVECNLERVRKGMRLYEENKLKQHFGGGGVN